MKQKKFEEIDLIDILLFFWNKKIIILTFSIIGLLIGYVLTTNSKSSYENIHKTYFHDNKEEIMNEHLGIDIFKMYFRAALNKEKQNEFIMSKFALNDEEANAISSSFMINDDENARWVKIKHVNQDSKFSNEKISYEYAKFVRDHINDIIQNLIVRNIESSNLNFVIEEKRLKSEILIQKDLETKLKDLRKKIINNNIQVAEKLNIESPSNLLQVIENKSSAYALSIEQYGGIDTNDFPNEEMSLGKNIVSDDIQFINDENKLFLYGTIVLKSALDTIDESNQIANYSNIIKLEKIKNEKALNTFKKKYFYENNAIDIDDITIVSVSVADNYSSVKIASKYYPYIGLIIGFLLGLTFSLIYAGMTNRLASEE